MAQYPPGLPLPELANYSASTNVGLTLVRFENGMARQRRSARINRHSFSMSFVFTSAQLWTWQSWANQYGFDWHSMLMESPYSGLSVSGANLIPHTIRYTSDISLEVVSQGYMRASIIAEMDVTTLPQGIVTFTSNWVRGGTPAATYTDAFRGGTPATPSVDTVTAGSPALPAA